MPRSNCHPQVAAFLDMIAFSEGTRGRGDDGYNKLVNPAGFFDSYATHPNVLVQVNPTLKSTAAGRYQFLSKHWAHYRDQLGLPDFGPESQDAWAIQLIRERKALDDVLKGRIPQAVAKCANIWASLPGAGYGQREHKLADLLTKFTEFGGVWA
ncbi:glycoside hydrolase family 24 protein [Aeromonas salmonicida]|uniref:glycoside hydrolase family 24 protein n=1 Tax=Aeromonas salmonicida TaxID=645 RepID=UPI000A0FBCB2|nr:glycoside hydrolase family 104 protein [Aeromonas salmonicida]ORJ10740.1 lysozyme [Aeromonas salmonicida]ORJ17009.1 lysozyme [Aeromonas salmonicida]WCH32880.1 glycoside hydrolase family 104 protein [Aeromonas salmonicida]WCH37090.1 glycoside hydrolase family 104 protein [Aeromonas salmonicida]WGI37834.1 glycoside hydrolase family 104 protein [Aeromonas salmonicida]